jgi:hypothetical protein
LQENEEKSITVGEFLKWIMKSCKLRYQMTINKIPLRVKCVENNFEGLILDTTYDNRKKSVCLWTLTKLWMF